MKNIALKTLGLFLLTVAASSMAKTDEKKIEATFLPNSAIVIDQNNAISTKMTTGTIKTLSPHAANLASYKTRFGTTLQATVFDPKTKVSHQIMQLDDASIKQGQYVALTGSSLKLKPLNDIQGRQYETIPVVLVTRREDNSIQNLRLDRFSDGLTWKKNGRSYSADIFLAVHDIDKETSSATLESPITVRVSGVDLESDPTEVAISELGFNGEKRVKIYSDAMNRPVKVTLRSAIETIDPTEFTLDVVSEPKLSLHINPRSIAGYGIGATVVTVDSKGLLPSGFPLILESSAGTLAPQEVTFDAKGQAISTLWSSGTGVATLAVGDERFHVNAVDVEFQPPIGFIVACLLGATLGAAIHYLMGRSKRPDETSIWSFSTAFLFGFGITFVVYAGFNVPMMLDTPVGRSGLIVVFATAIIGSILTRPIYDFLTRLKSSS